ncbi:MAG: glycosyltransferase family 39 protein [Gemmatimonadales bacterium]|nr:glycosyltransferase family 39 protein [Gemmatimonadales bacterium]
MRRSPLPWRDVAWLLAIAGVAVLTRAYGLVSRDLFTDEMATLFVARTGQQMFGPMYATAPINFILTRIAVRLVGADELGIRILPMLFGVAGVVVIFFTASRWFNRRVGLFASLVLALSMWHVSWSQAGRHFALQALLILLGIHWFVRYWKEPKWAHLSGSAVLLLAALFVHSSSGFYVVAVIGFLLIEYIRDRRSPADRHWDPAPYRRALLSYGTILLLYLPIYVVVGRYLLEERTAWNPPWNIVGSFAFYLPPWLTLPAMAGAVILAGERDRLWLLMVSLTAVPLMLLTAASAVTIASAAYCLSSIVAVAALAGVAADRLLERSARGLQRTAAVLLIGGVFVSLSYDLALYHTAYNRLRPRWHDVARYVAEHRAVEEQVWAEEGDVMQYYLGREGVDWLSRYVERPDSVQWDRRCSTGTWFVVHLTDSPILQISTAFLRQLQAHARLARLFPAHYGPKDRTLALFYLPCTPQPSGRLPR